MVGKQGDRRSKRQKVDHVALSADTEEDIHNLVTSIFSTLHAGTRPLVEGIAR
jgi:hypothetical protein